MALFDELLNVKILRTFNSSKKKQNKMPEYLNIVDRQLTQTSDLWLPSIALCFGNGSQTFLHRNPLSNF